MHPALVIAAMRATQWAFNRWNQRSPAQAPGGIQLTWYVVPTEQLRSFLVSFPNAMRGSCLLAELHRHGREDLIPQAGQQLARMQLRDPHAIVMVVVDD